MFDQLVTDEEMEAARLTSDSLTVAGLLAALYADPTHPMATYLAVIPTVEGLLSALDSAVQCGAFDAVCAIAEELCRIRGEETAVLPSVIYGSSAGLFRLH